MDHVEVLLGHAQLSVALAGFASLMLGIVRGRKSAILSAWAARIVVVLAMFSATICVVTLALLTTSLTPSQVWFLSSIVFMVTSAGGLAIMIWDTRRVYAAGIREQNPLVSVLCWIVGGGSLLLNFVNLIVPEARFLYLYGSLVGIAVPALLLFLQNIVLLSNDPSRTKPSD